MKLSADFELTSDAIGWVYSSFRAGKASMIHGRDRDVRHPEWTRRILDGLGRPDACGYNVAVTGSKGKGSNAILLAGVLQRLGFRVGLFTGPHLVDYMERFRVNGEVIPETKFVDLVGKVRSVVNKFHVPDGQYIGPVGILAAVAALWFREQKTDVNIYECGRGALHDDVNQIKHTGAVVAPVFLEHAWELGPTLQDVAEEKAGVITADTRWVVSHPQVEVVRATLAKHLADVMAHHTLGMEFDMKSTIGVHATTVAVDYPSGDHYTLQLPACEGYWLGNAAVALAAARHVWHALRTTEPMDRIVDLTSLRLRGRLDVVRKHPLVVVDGTIHADSAQYVARWIQVKREAGVVKQVGAIIAIPADKDGYGVLSVLGPLLDWVVLTKAHNPHLQFNDGFTLYAKEHVPWVGEAAYLEEAMTAIPSLAQHDALLLLGTQSFVGDALAYFGESTRSIWTS